MRYRKFGQTGKEVSIIGFGAMRLPTLEDGTCDYEQSVPMLQRGIDLGINYFDSAYVYINGTSEVALGKAIKGYDRDRFFIVTKIPAGDEAASAEAEWRRKLDESLRRFDTSCIDLVYFHGLRWQAFEDHVSKPGFALEAARKAQDEGLIRHVGFSSHDTADNIIRLIDTGEFEGVLMQYNFLERTNEPAIARAAERGLGVSIMGPIAGGRLGEGNNEDQETVKTPELALRFVWSNPGVTALLSGMNDLNHIEENVATANRSGELTASEEQQILELVEKNARLAELYCTGCGYCLPCPNEVNIPENFRYMNWHRVWGLEEAAKKAYNALSEKGTWSPWAGSIAGLKAEACIQCGECEPKCPQNIPIIEQLEEVATTLGG